MYFSIAAFEEVLKTYYSAFWVDNYAHTVTVSFDLLPSCYKISKISVVLALYSTDEENTESYVIKNETIINTYEVSFVYLNYSFFLYQFITCIAVIICS